MLSIFFGGCKMWFIFGLIIIMGMFAAMLSSTGMSADAILLTVPFTLVGGLLLFVLLKFALGIKAHFAKEEPDDDEIEIVNGQALLEEAEVHLLTDNALPIQEGVIATCTKEESDEFLNWMWSLRGGRENTRKR
jgi:hypothetical protein